MISTAAGTMIVNSDAFDERALQKAGYAANPLTDGSLSGYTALRGPDDEHHHGGGEAVRAPGRGMRSAPRTSSPSG